MLADALERSVPDWRNPIAVATGLVFGACLFLIISKTQRAFSISNSSFVVSRESVCGLICGMTASAASIFLAILSSDWTFGSFSSEHIVDQILFQVRPALIEEIGFRYGIVVFALRFFGRNSALVAGAIPFGVLHLLNFVSGQPIFWEYILGTAIAGLFLTLIFLRHGLAAAILAHYSWNVLVSITSEILNIRQESIEGGVGTFAVLVVLCLWLNFGDNVRKRASPKGLSSGPRI